jgi:putative type I restriction-modification system S protein
MTQESNIFPYIARLLQGAEVVWKPLEEVATFRRGSFPQPYTKSEWYGGDNSMPFVQVADMEDNKFNLVPITKQKISQLAMPKSIFVPKGTILVSLQGTIGRVAITQYDSYVDRTIAIFTHIDNEIDIRYFAYQLQLIFGIKKENARGSTIKTITKEEFSAFQIPLPPLSVQQEIVRILDKFTELEAELEAELDCRKHQYEYYRNKLLAYKGNEVEWKMLGEVAIKIYSGGTPKTEESKYWEKGTIPWMSSGEVNLGTIYQTEKFITEEGLANSSAKFVPVDSLVIALAGQGKTRGKVARIKIKLTTNQSLAALTFDSNKVSSDYVYHYMVTQYEKLRQISSGSGTRGGLNLQMISNFPIPLPPFSEQQRIASILDKFDTLVNSISEGLPKEIALRRKQYEYYREKLLTFTNDK